ncbi:MAG: hypothetical protein JWM40_1835 [Frankiales bacterium]|nr:hypothetical protein [Frankiales bacterium]
MRLADLAHCRAGDKGDDAVLAVIPYEAADLARITALLVPEVVAAHFGGMPTADVEVVEALGALVLTLRNRLGGGVTSSLGIDPHGKTLSGHLLTLGVPA